MSYYLKTGNTYKVASNDAIDISTLLPAQNFIVQVDPRGEFYLEHVDSFTTPSKIYGDALKNSARIINTFNDRPAATGILLTGEKGSGKTMLAKNLSIELAKQGLPTIIINNDFHGDAFNKLIQSIEQPAVIIFDEFEKVYGRDEQEQILTLLDGVFPTKKLFILTTNDTSRVNDLLVNRPGRIYYAIRYEGLDAEFITQYCEDNLQNKKYIEQICKIATVFRAFNFDLLKALVEEMNRYDETPSDALRILNAIPETNSGNKYQATIIIDGKEIDPNWMYDDGAWTGNPLGPYGVDIRVSSRAIDSDKAQDDDEYDWSWVDCTVTASDLISIDVHTGIFTFNDGKGKTIILTKEKSKFFNFDAF